MQNAPQAERVLRVLADGAWHTTSEIQRRAGVKRVASQISDLRRRKGAKITCDHIPKRRGPRAFRYQWRNIPPNVRLAVEEGPGEIVYEVPRTRATRYRIYVVPRFGAQMLMDTAATPEEVGRKIVELGEDGQLDGCCLGLLDSKGIPKEINSGQWLLNPHEGRW